MEEAGSSHGELVSGANSGRLEAAPVAAPAPCDEGFVAAAARACRSSNSGGYAKAETEIDFVSLSIIKENYYDNFSISGTTLRRYYR